MFIGRASRCVLLSLILTLGLSAFACAAVSGPFATTTPIAYTLTDWNGTLAFPKFDSSLGVLTQVDLSVTAAMRTTLTVKNNASSTSNGLAKTEVAVTVTDGATITLGPDFFSPNFTFALNPGESVTSPLLTKSATDSQSYFDAPTLSAFTGPGTIVFNAGTYTMTWLSYNGGNTEAVQVTDASCTGTVTYYYEIPEPSGFMVLAPMVLGLVTMIKRRS